MPNKPKEIVVKIEEKPSRFGKFKEEFLRGVEIGFDIVDEISNKYEELADRIAKMLVGRR